MTVLSFQTAFLIGVSHIKNKHIALDSFNELAALCDTAGLKVLDKVFVNLKEFQSATYLGFGKVNEIKEKRLIQKTDVVVIDAELSPVQNRNLEKEWGCLVVDRTRLILDIFALHAKSKEGKLQVELAQYQYLYPRLVGAWTHLSKQRGGGVGLRGPGETQLEVDRRLVRDKIDFLKKCLKKVESARSLHRRKREAIPIPTISLIGYTNAGKSTLFNTLTQANELAADQLFATLDPKTKKIVLPSSRHVLITDTVGFIRQLPHQLVEAFKSTFEEARESDLLLHVVDSSHPDRLNQMKVVNDVLQELHLSDIPVIPVFNKIDSVGDDAMFDKEGVSISALNKVGIEKLLKKIDEALTKDAEAVAFLIPYSEGQLLNMLYERCRVLKKKIEKTGTRVTALVNEKTREQLKKYII